MLGARSGCGGCGSVHVFIVDAEHLGQALIAIVDISRMHLIEDEVFTLVILLPQLRLQLIEVNRQVLTSSLFELLLL